MSGAKGKVVGGKYRLDELLGQGGMGEVWRATHLELEAPVAIKLIQARGANPDHIVARFLNEAKAAAAVRHRNVVRITDFGTIEDGKPFMVMELLEGRSLADRLDKGPPMPVSDLVDVMAQCLSGLSAVHGAGLVHRDLKPENIFLVDDADGVYPKLLDFGVSRSVPGSGQSDRRGAMTTGEGMLVGTPHYMSPEQARGLRDIDSRTDIYGVGVVLYEALSGHLPFDSPHVGDLIMAVAAGGAKPLFEHRPDLGEELSEVVGRAMSRDRELRYPDARAMRTALLTAGRNALAGFAPRVSSADITGAFGVQRPARESVETLDSYPPGSPMRTSSRPAATPRGGSVTAAIDGRGSAPPTTSSIRPAPKPSGRGAVMWAGAAVVGLGLAAGAVVFFTQGATPPAATTATPAVSAPPPAISPVPPHEEPPALPAAPAAPALARVTLHGLPTGATVLVDGAETQPAGETLSLTHDGRDHALEVRAPGHLPWSAHVTATSDVTLAVELALAPAGEHHHHHGHDATAETGAAAAAGTATTTTTGENGIYRDPGF